MQIADEFVEAEIAIDELHVVRKAVIGNELFERFAIDFAFVTAHDRMRLAEDQIQRFGMLRDDVAHRFDRVLEALAAIDQSEGRDHLAIAEAESGLRHVVSRNATSGTP